MKIVDLLVLIKITILNTWQFVKTKCQKVLLLLHPLLLGVWKSIKKYLLFIIELWGDIIGWMFRQFIYLKSIFLWVFGLKELYVKEYWLTSLNIKVENQPQILVPGLQKHIGPIKIDEALQMLVNENSNKSSTDNIPVYCLGNPNFIISNIRSFFSSSVPDQMQQQIIKLKLQNPFEIVGFVKNIKGTLGKTFIDIDIDRKRIIVLGNPDLAINEFNSIGKKLIFSQKSESEKISMISNHLALTTKNYLGSNLLWGGFSAIFIFEITFLLERFLNLLNLKFLSLNDFLSTLFFFCISIFGFISFFFSEVFEDRLFAFEKIWTILVKRINIFIFILFIFSFPLLYSLFNYSLTLTPIIIASLSIIFSILLITSSFGQIWFAKGLSKKLWVTWLVELILIILIYAFSIGKI